MRRARGLAALVAVGVVALVTASVPCADDDICFVAAVQASSDVQPEYKQLLTACSVLATYNSIYQTLSYCTDANAASIAKCCPLTCSAECTPAPTAVPTEAQFTTAPTVVGATSVPSAAPTTLGSVLPRLNAFCVRKSRVDGVCGGEEHYFERIEQFRGPWNPCAVSKFAVSRNGTFAFTDACEKDPTMGRQELRDVVEGYQNPLGQPYNLCGGKVLGKATRVCDRHGFALGRTKSDGTYWNGTESDHYTGSYSTYADCTNASRVMYMLDQMRDTPTRLFPSLNYLTECHANNPLVTWVPRSIDPFADVGIAFGVDLPVTLAFIDVDLDGDDDLFAGTSTGQLLYFENTGTPHAPEFTERTGAAHPLGGSDAISRPLWDRGEYENTLTPTAVDIDGDGILDLVIGSRFSVLLFAKGLDDGTFADVACRGATTLERTSDSGCPLLIAQINSTITAHAELCFADPTFTDIDGDGQLYVSHVLCCGRCL